MNINLLFLCDLKHGGPVNTLARLRYAFSAMGYGVTIYKLRKRTESRMRPLRGMSYINLCMNDMIEVTRNDLTLIVTAHLKDEQYIDASYELMVNHGAGLFVGGDGELARGDDCEDFARYLAAMGVKVIVPRESIRDWCSEVYGLDSVIARLPVPASMIPFDGIGNREHHAVSFTTLHRDKHTDWSFIANDNLPEDKRIEIWGNFVGNPYWFWNGLPDGIKEKWDLGMKLCLHYHGPLSAEDTNQAVVLASKSTYCMDLMDRKMALSDMYDGGDLETVGMEALCGGSILVMHRNWVSCRSDSRLIENHNCVAVEDPQELEDLLLYEDPNNLVHTIYNGRKLLREHVPRVVVPLYVDYLEERCQRIV